MSHQDIGLVLSGGGTATAYAIGALHAAYVEHGISTPRCMIMISGGASIGCFGLARRFKEMYQWPIRFADRRCVSRFRFWRMWDIDFTVDNIMLAQVPALGREVATSPTRISIAATEMPSGVVRWFTNKDLAEIRNILKASKAIPGVYGKEVAIEGKTYIDGSFGVTLRECVEKAFAEGAKKVIVIDVQESRVSALTALSLRLLSARQGRHVRASVERFIARGDDSIEASSNVVVCRPRSLQLRSAIDTDPVRTLQTIEQGYAEMAALKI